MMNFYDEYEVTYFKENNFIDLKEENIMLMEPLKSKTFKCSNYVYIISGNLKYKNKLVIKLNHGQLFAREISKEREKSNSKSIQHYREFPMNNNKWIPLQNIDVGKYLLENSYIYFSNKTKYTFDDLGISIRQDNTSFLDVEKMKIEKQIQYLEVEANDEERISNNLKFFNQVFIDKFGFQLIRKEMSKIEVCKEIRKSKLPDIVEDFNQFINSIFRLVYYDLLTEL